MDDGSTDGSVEILDRLVSEFGDRLSVLKQSNKGAYPARNLGLSKARGKYIAFLDADDYWETDCLEKLHRQIITTNADLVYCGWQNVGENIENSQPHVPPKYEDGDICLRFLKNCPWPIHAALTRRTIIEEVGGFSESWPSSMDFDFWLRISAVTLNICILPEVLSYYRWHGDTQISAVKWKQTINAWRVRKRFVEEYASVLSHVPERQLKQLINSELLKAAYTAYWKRDLTSSQKLFRKALLTGAWASGDLRYLLPSLLPASVYKSLISSLASRS